MSLRNLVLAAAGSTKVSVFPTPGISNMKITASHKTINDNWGGAEILCFSENDNGFILGGTAGRIYVSSDGLTWTAVNHLKDSTDFGYNDVKDIIWTGTKYIAIGANGRIATSPDGLTWTYAGSPLSSIGIHPNTDFNSIATNGNVLVIVGSKGRVAWTNNDGVSWATSVIGSTSTVFSKVIWTGSRFIAAAANCMLYASSDGVNWTNKNGIYNNLNWPTNDVNLTDIIKTPTGIFAGGTYGRIALSYNDGDSWIQVATSATTGMTDGTLIKLKMIGNEIFAFGGPGRYCKSTGGTSWLQYPNTLRTFGWPSSYNVKSVHAGRGKILLGGESGTLMCS